jgi:hypothetical protein
MVLPAVAGGATSHGRRATIHGRQRYQPWPAALPWFGGDAAIGGEWCYRPCMAMLQGAAGGAVGRSRQATSSATSRVDMLPAMLPYMGGGATVDVWRCYHWCVTVLQRVGCNVLSPE